MALGLIGYFFFGINPLTIIDAANQLAPVSQEEGRTGTPQDRASQFVDTIVSSTTDVWKAGFGKVNRSYQAPRLVLYEQAATRDARTGRAGQLHAWHVRTTTALAVQRLSKRRSESLRYVQQPALGEADLRR